MQHLISRIHTVLPRLIALATLTGLSFGVFAYTATAQTIYVISDDGDKTALVSESSDMDDVLAEAGLTVRDSDVVTASQNGAVAEINIDRVDLVTVSCDGILYVVQTDQEPISQILSNLDITLSDEDRLNYLPGTAAENGMYIEVTRVSTEYSEIFEEIPYNTVIYEDASLDAEKQIVISEGQNGKIVTTEFVTMENGQEISREVIQTEIIESEDEVLFVGVEALDSDEDADSVNTTEETKNSNAQVEVELLNEISETDQPASDSQDADAEDSVSASASQTAVVTQSDEPSAESMAEPAETNNAAENEPAAEPAEETGEDIETEVAVETEREDAETDSTSATAENTITTASGDVMTYTQILSCEATAYTCEGQTWNITYSGTTARYGAIAVDPSVIPLGTELYVVCDDGYCIYGYCVAEDTGGAIVGNKIDLYFDTYVECINFGRRQCTVYILG